MLRRLLLFLPVIGQYASGLLAALFVGLDASGFEQSFRWEILWVAFSGAFVLLTLGRDLARFVGSRPNLVPLEYVNDVRPWNDMITDDRIATLHFAHINFINDPRLSEPEAKALAVVAHTTFFLADGTTVATGVKEFQGRWAHKEQPSGVGQYGSIHELITTDMEPNGQRHTLTIAFKYPEDDVCYVWDNEIARLPDLRRDRRYKMRGELFRVRVRLRGQRVDKTYWFLLRNLGVGLGLEISRWER